MQSNKTSKLSGIPFLSFLYAAAAGHIIFAIPAIGGVLILNLTDVKSLFFIFIPIAILSIPISAAFSWLIAKGSNWTNTTSAIIAACSVPGRFYAVLFGGLFGFRLFYTAGGIIFAVLFYFIALVITIPIGTRISKKVIASLDTQDQL
jgi:hypothetical protein